MKKTIKMIAFIALFCIKSVTSFGQSNGTSIKCSEIPANPTPHMAINDFAGIIDANQKSAMESQLSSYWDSTSIAICVVTIPSLGSYDQFDYSTALFNCWGIGGKDNRGLLIFVALKEHKISIRTGYGLEAYITDAKSSDLISNMKPHFKQEKYSDGIAGCVNEIISTLGTMSWEDRMEALQQRKDAEAKESADQKELFMNVLFGLGIIALLVFIIYQIIKSIKKARRKEDLNIFIDKIKKEIDKANFLLKDSLKSFSNEAVWAKNEAEDHMRICQKSIDQASAITDKCLSSININLDETEEKAQEAAMLLEKAFKSFTKMEEDLKLKVRRIEAEAPNRLIKAQEIVTRNSGIISDFIRSGFNFDEAQSHQLAFKHKLAEYNADIKNKERQSEIYTDSFVVKEKSEKLISQIQEIVSQKEMIDAKLGPLVVRATEAKNIFDKADASLQILKKNYPEKVWSGFESVITNAKKKFATEKLQDTANEIKKLNSIDVQNFSSALLKFNMLESLVNETFQACDQVDTAVTKQYYARTSYPASYKSIENVVAGVLKESKDSDVSGATKNAAKDLTQKLTGIKISSEKILVDWLGLVGLLESIKDDANSILRKIKSEIEAAERERKREAERARERAEESRRSSFSGYSYDSGSSSISISSFGGFGGGSTGGGGADGGW